MTEPLNQVRDDIHDTAAHRHPQRRRHRPRDRAGLGRHQPRRSRTARRGDRLATAADRRDGAREPRPHAAARRRWRRCRRSTAGSSGRSATAPTRRCPNAINPHPILRKQFNLFANVRPTRSYPDIGCLHDGVDLVIVRENNEGFQPDRNMVLGSGEFRPTDEVTLSVRVITRTGSRRVARAAFELARAAAQAPDLRAQGHGVQAQLRHVRRGVQEARAPSIPTCGSTT